MRAVLCPRCNIAVMYVTDKETIPKEIRCKRCKWIVRYIPATHECKLIETPSRTTAGGLRFY